MSKLGSICICFFVLLYPLYASASNSPPVVPKVWTAKNSVEFALLNSPDNRIALQRINMAGAAVERAKVGYYPSVDISALYGQTNNPMYSFGNILNQGNFTPSIDFNDPGRTDDLNLRAGVEYRLYNGGRDQAGVEAAEAGLARSHAEREVVHSRLAFEVVRSFQGIIQAQKLLEARTVSIAAIQASLEVARARFQAGDLLKADLLNLEVQESRASENLILATHRLELSRKVFLNLLGLQRSAVQIDLTQKYVQTIPSERSYALRPELDSYKRAEQVAVAKLEAAHGGKLPTVDGFASYQYDKGFVVDGNGDSWMAGVKVNYRIFDGHKTSADIAQAMAELSTVRAQLEKIELAMDLEVKQADLNYHQAVQRLEVTNKMVEQAEESARLSRTRFREGVILSSDLIDVEMRLTDALVRQSVASASISVASADLRRAMGLPQFEGMFKEGESK